MSCPWLAVGAGPNRFRSRARLNSCNCVTLPVARRGHRIIQNLNSRRRRHHCFASHYIAVLCWAVPACEAAMSALAQCQLRRISRSIATQLCDGRGVKNGGFRAAFVARPHSVRGLSSVTSGTDTQPAPLPVSWPRWADPSIEAGGLFGCTGLMDPSDFVAQAEEAIEICARILDNVRRPAFAWCGVGWSQRLPRDGLMAQMLSDKQPDGLSLLQQVDLISDTVCKVCDAAECCRVLHVDKYVRASRQSCYPRHTGVLLLLAVAVTGKLRPPQPWKESASLCIS